LRSRKLVEEASEKEWKDTQISELSEEQKFRLDFQQTVPLGGVEKTREGFDAGGERKRRYCGRGLLKTKMLKGTCL